VNNYNSFLTNLIADEMHRFEMAGDFIFLRDALQDVEIFLDSDSNDAIPLKKGERLVTRGFYSFFIKSTINQSVRLIVAPSSTAEIEGVTIVGDIVLAKSQSPDSAIYALVAGALANTIYELAPPDSGRKELILQADPTNTASVFVFPTGSAVGEGLEIYPGEKLAFESAAGWSFSSPTINQKIRKINNRWT
jgi:hypothetical protein